MRATSNQTSAYQPTDPPAANSPQTNGSPRTATDPTATPQRAKTYQCQCRISTANAQDCAQYAAKEDYPFYGAGQTGAGQTGAGQTDRGQWAWGGWDPPPGPGGPPGPPGGSEGAKWQGSPVPKAPASPVTDGQPTDSVTQCDYDGQDYHDADRETLTPSNVEDTPGACEARQPQEERGAIRLPWPGAGVGGVDGAAAPRGPTPRPKVTHIAPPFQGTAVFKGEFQDVKLSDYRGRYLCLFFYPLDFTFVCPTEIRAMSDLHQQFKQINCAILGCSCDSHFTHLAYLKTPKQHNGLGEITFPLLSDFTKKISADYNVLTEDGTSLRALFIIDPVGIIRNITINDAGVGRNTDEVLRMVQAIKHVDDFDEMCPNGWVPGGVTVAPTRVAAFNYYKQLFSDKQDDSGSSHIQQRQNHVN